MADININIYFASAQGRILEKGNLAKMRLGLFGNRRD